MGGAFYFMVTVKVVILVYYLKSDKEGYHSKSRTPNATTVMTDFFLLL